MTVLPMKVSSYIALLALAVLAVNTSAFALEALANGSRIEGMLSGLTSVDGTLFFSTTGITQRPVGERRHARWHHRAQAGYFTL